MASSRLFVDDPVAAVRDADVLVIEVMRERGYPMDDFDQRAADVSVDHPDVVHNYRSGHAIAMSSDRGEASTEALRTATLHYRALFQELLSPGRDDEPAKIAQAERREARDRGSDGRGAGTESTQRRA